MKNKLVRLTHVSGEEASVYSIYCSHQQNVLFEQFCGKFINNYPCEIMDIVRRLRSIGTQTGALENFFKMEEGLEWDDLVCALYDVPEKNMRLYCMRLTDQLVIAGSGGPKPKHIRKWQEDPVLSSAVHEMMHFSKIIRTKLEHGSLYLSNDELLLQGNLVLIS